MSMCPICEQYLCYVHSVVWIHNLHINFVQIFVQIHQLTRKEKKRRAKSMDEKILWTTEMKRQYAHYKVYSSKYKTR